MSRREEFKLAWIFLGITVGLNLLVFWGPLAIFKVPAASFDGGSSGPAWAIALFIIGGFTPSLTALVLTLIRDGRKGLIDVVKRLNPLRMSLKWHGIVLLVVVLCTIGQLVIVRLIGAEFDYTLFGKRLVWLLPLLILGPLSEELGWRGYALGRLQTRLNALSASLIIGLFWALWHLPLFYIIGTSQNLYGMSFPAFTAGLLTVSVLYTWVYNSTGGSIWSAVFFHWMFTYFMDTMGSGLAPPPEQYHVLQYIPYVLIAVIVVVIWKPTKLSKKDVDNEIRRD
jgi:membrane protease YdiL (CAAX protease family)